MKSSIVDIMTKILGLTDGVENGEMKLRVIMSGARQSALTLSAPSTNETSAVLFVDQGGVVSIKRVKIGANNTGPSGSGAALYIDNA